MSESTPTRDLYIHPLHLVPTPYIRDSANLHDLPGGQAPDENLDEYRARMGEEAWSRNVQSTEWQTTRRMSSVPIDVLVRTSTPFIYLQQENTRLGLELEAVRADLQALTRYHEGLTLQHQRLSDNYLEATVDLDAGTEHLAVLNRQAGTRDSDGAAPGVPGLNTASRTRGVPGPDAASGSGGAPGPDALPGLGGHGTSIVLVVDGMPGDVPQEAARFRIQEYRHPYRKNTVGHWIAVESSPPMAGASGSESDDDSDSGLIRTFDIPDENATRTELLNVGDRPKDPCVNAQLEMGRLVVENRAMRGKVAVFEQSNKKQQNTNGPDVHGYLGGIKMLGKKFGFMQEPWITLAVFTAAPVNGSPPQSTPEDIEAMFKTPKLYLQYLTCTIYDHVPHKYHDLVDSTTFPNFGNNFLKYLNAGRSSAVNVLKANLSKILAECEITNNKGDLLYHPGEDRKGPPSAYPPIFYTGQKKNIQTRLLNPVLPMALRCMIFGPASTGDKGSVKPLSTTLGYLWQLPTEGLTIGSIAFTLTAIIGVLSGVDTQFEEKGKISGIPFQTYFRSYKKLLMKTAETPGVRNILRFWTKTVFKKVAAAGSLDEPVIPDDEAEAAAEAEFAAAMEAMALGEDLALENPAVAFDWGQNDIDNGEIGCIPYRLESSLIRYLAAASEPERQVDGQRQDIDSEPEPEPEEEQPAPVAARRHRGGARRRGGARGGAVVLDSDEDPAGADIVPEPRRGGRRGVAVPTRIEELPVQKRGATRGGKRR
ncbi:hypothetical protein C8F04DRAFT_1311581 [Mycena alexandri]|uniref:Uncharacterized protein n=1 Tax=Mycena alexandri TaxID=1745969 RepID=A0AAD6WPH9_9AGAR|nr:hypothetical protein C8F04DRAFT_1311581 [Mycena alexandri]